MGGRIRAGSTLSRIFRLVSEGAGSSATPCPEVGMFDGRRLAALESAGPIQGIDIADPDFVLKGLAAWPSPNADGAVIDALPHEINIDVGRWTHARQSRKIARSVISGLARRARASVRSPRNASSSPFLQHQPLQREQAVCATRVAKPVGSGRTGEVRPAQCFAVRISRNVPIRCSRNRRIRSGATATSALSLRGTITG